MDEAKLALALAILTIIGNTLLIVVPRLFERRKTEAETRTAEAKTAESLIDSSGKVADMWQEVAEKERQARLTVEQRLEAVEKDIARLRGVEVEVKHLRDAFDYLCNEVKHDYPESVRIARLKADGKYPDAKV